METTVRRSKENNVTRYIIRSRSSLATRLGRRDLHAFAGRSAAEVRPPKRVTEPMALLSPPVSCPARLLSVRLLLGAAGEEGNGFGIR